MNMRGILKNHYKSPFPAMNFHIYDEPVETNNIYSDTLAIDGNYTCAQLFFGIRSLFSYICYMKTNKQFVNTLEE